MKSAITVLASCALLAACAPTLSNVNPKIDQLTVPDVVGYAPDVQDKAAKEIESNACPTLNSFMVDYGVMRDQARAALGKKVNVNR